MNEQTKAKLRALALGRNQLAAVNELIEGPAVASSRYYGPRPRYYIGRSFIDYSSWLGLRRRILQSGAFIIQCRTRRTHTLFIPEGYANAQGHSGNDSR